MAKILITGSRGMVGRSICENVEANKHELIKPSKEELNLIDPDIVENFLNREKPDIVIHAAGVVGGILANISEPTRFFYDNLQIGLNLVTKSKKNWN